MEVYLHIAEGRDKHLGHVDEGGQVYRDQVGPDDLVGHANLSTGQIYRQRPGPDKQVGRVDLGSGKVYAARLGPDRYVGQAEGDGSLRLRDDKPDADLVGRVEPFVSYAHSAAALLLLVAPALESQAQQHASDQGKKDS